MKKLKTVPSSGNGGLDVSLFFSRSLDFLETYIPKQSDGSKNTVSTYKIGLSTFRSYIHDEKNISIRRFRFADCTYDFILDYRNWLHDIKGYKESTVNNRLASLRSYLNYSAARDVALQQTAFAISEVPMYRVPKVIRPVIDHADTLLALLDAPGNTRLGLRDRAILILLFDTAVRVEELITADYSDVNIFNPDPYIHVYGKGGKERKVYFSSGAIGTIQQYLCEFHPNKDRKMPFFYTTIHGKTGHMSRRNVERIVNKYADQVRREHKDLPEAVYPHMLRRTRASGLYRDGVDISVIATLLGHSQVQTTKDHYALPSIEQMRAAMEPGASVEPVEQQLWPDDEDEIAKLCGLN